MRSERAAVARLVAVAVALAGCGAQSIPGGDDGGVIPVDAGGADAPAGDVALEPHDPTCPGTQARCGTVCTDVTISPFHCGLCAVRCAPGQECAGGVCRAPECPEPTTTCAGACVNVQTNTQNCGACGVRCAAGEVCLAGVCQLPPCPTNWVRCNGQCADLATNMQNCGTCGVACPTGMGCDQGTCRVVCAPPTRHCGDPCVDVTSDPNNCGGCGFRCDADAVCRASRCRGPHDPTYALSPGALTDWVDACAQPGARTLLANQDDAADRAVLPFALRYWGVGIPAGSMVNVCSNGWIGLDGMTSNSLGGTLPGTVAPNDVVAAHWGDLYTRAAGVCVATVGAAPSRRFVVEWNDVQYCCGTNTATHLTFEVVLEEATGAIEMLYPTMTGQNAMTVGLENATGDDAVSPCPPGTRCMVAAGSATRYTPVN